MDRASKLLLISLIAATVAPTVAIVDGSTVSLARFFGYLSLILIWWQIMLGNRIFNRLITHDLVSINRWHRFMGTYGFFLLVTHYGLMALVYGLEPIISTNLSDSFVVGIKYGLAAFYLALGIWLSSALLRKKLSWDLWKRLHYAAYAVFILGFVHSGQIGPSHETYPLIEALRLVLIGGFSLVTAWRVAWWAGIGKLRYRVKQIEDVARGVKKITLQPLGSSKLQPAPGQFAYFQYKRFDQAHPFTVSHFNEAGGEVSFSIKASGDWTKRLHKELQVGQTVFLDGPYGVFTSDIAEQQSPVVMVAGGIGITPFIRWLESGRVKALFYGNQTAEDIAYRQTAEQSGADVTLMLDKEAASGTQKGYVTADLIQQKLRGTLGNYQFYICGPPPMMDKVSQDLAAAGVPPGHIHTERFSL